VGLCREYIYFSRGIGATERTDRASWQKHEVLRGELCVVEAELEGFSADRQCFDALWDVCNALDKLRELEADELFWEGVAEARNAVGHVERARIRVTYFEGRSAAFWRNKHLSRSRSTNAWMNWTSSTKK